MNKQPERVIAGAEMLYMPLEVQQRVRELGYEKGEGNDIILSVESAEYLDAWCDEHSAE